jgi:hypothetical protein
MFSVNLYQNSEVETVTVCRINMEEISKDQKPQVYSNFLEFHRENSIPHGAIVIAYYVLQIFISHPLISSLIFFV